MSRLLFFFHGHFFGFFVTGNQSIFTGKIWGVFCHGNFFKITGTFSKSVTGKPKNVTKKKNTVLPQKIAKFAFCFPNKKISNKKQNDKIKNRYSYEFKESQKDIPIKVDDSIASNALSLYMDLSNIALR